MKLRPIAATVAVLATVTAGACSGSGSASPTTATPPTSTTIAPTTTSAPSTTDPKMTSEDLMELARQSVVRVRNTGCGELSVGSAWLADDGRMVSNQHVVEGVRGLEMSTWDGRDMTVASIEAADTADVSRVVATWPPAAVLRPMSVRTTRVEPGERIAILGYPEGGELKVSTGVSLGYATDLDLAPREILKLTNVVKPGNSGGPAVDQLGRVVGVVYAEEIKTDAALVIPITDAVGPTAVPMQPVLACS